MKDEKEVLEKAEDELIKKINETFKKMVGEGEHLEILKIKGKDQLISLLESILGEDKERDKIVKCMPCLLDAFKKTCAKLKGDHISYAGAVSIATLMAVISKDIMTMETKYSDRLTATLLKFAELVDILDEKELRGIKAREYLAALEKENA